MFPVVIQKCSKNFNDLYSEYCFSVVRKQMQETDADAHSIPW
jgi:hypothetical protein